MPTRKTKKPAPVKRLTPKAMKVTGDKVPKDGHFQPAPMPPAETVLIRYGHNLKSVPADSNFVTVISETATEWGLSYFDVIGPKGKITPETAPKNLLLYAGHILSLDKVDEVR